MHALASGLVQLTFEEEITRKRRMNLEALRNSGRAGDMTTVCGTRGRVEEDWDYAHKHVDSPAYARFAASACSPGTTTKLQLQRGRESGPQSLAAKQDQSDVISLEQWSHNHWASGNGQADLRSP